MTALRFQVSGMRSRSCVRAISARVSDVAGVRTVEVDLGAGTVRVTGAAEPSAVQVAITEAGYDAVPAGPAADPASTGHQSVGNRREEGQAWTAP